MNRNVKGIRESIEKYEAQREFGTGSSGEYKQKFQRESGIWKRIMQMMRVEFMPDHEQLAVRKIGSQKNWLYPILLRNPDRNNIIWFQGLHNAGPFLTGELAALAIALFSAIRQYKKNQNRAKLQAASMQAEQLKETA